MSQEQANLMILIDGSSYLFRAFHALPPLVTSKGQATGAIKGVINMIRSLAKNYPGSQLIVVFDAKGKTFRNDIYPEYKAHRPPMPDDLRTQIQPIHDIIRAMGLPLLVIEGVEADDVIGTLALQATREGIETLISTGDKDMAQLVSEHVKLINTMSNEMLDIEGVKAKFGVPPPHIVDYLALMGDKVDNIPGVPKVGEKTAVGIVAGLGSLEQVYDNLDKVAELDFRGAKTMGPKLLEHKEQALLSKVLATIKTDVELPFGLHDIKSEPENKHALLSYFREYEFKSWVKELGDFDAPQGDLLAGSMPVASAEPDETDDEPAAQNIDRSAYATVLNQAEWQKWLAALQQADAFAFDTETTSLNYMEAEIVGVSFAIEPGKAAYVPLAHDYAGAPEQLERNAVLADLKPLLEDASRKKIGQHLKYDAHVLRNHDINLRGIHDDTMLESYVLNSTATRHDMDSLAKKYLGHDTISFEDIAGKGAKQLTFNLIALEQAAPYAAEDADVTLRLHHTLSSKLAKAPSLLKLYREIEIPLVPVLLQIEENGARVDAQVLRLHSQQLAVRLLELEKEAHALAGREFNLASPKQLQEILFDELGLPVLKKTPKGQPSTDADVLAQLAEDYELPRLITEHRELAKLKSTYTDKLPEMINHRTGRIHTSYHQAITATGRLSSTDPNLQNIPVRNAEGRRIRQAFIASPGCKLLAADYSQIELRIMAHLSADKTLLDAFAQGKDVHRATAAEVMGVAEDQVTNEQRRHAKAINFGLIYGMSAFGLAKQIGVGRAESQAYIDKYFERYPGVKRYMDEIRSSAAEQGYVETLFGRRLYLPEINDRNGMRRQAAERTAINAPMQGSAADIIKLAMIAVQNWLEAEQLSSKIIMQVHDELVLEVPDAELEKVRTALPGLMAGVAKLDVPLEVEVGCGQNWDEAH